MDVAKMKTVTRVAVETLRECKQIPAGHLYAGLMAHGITFDEYNTIEGFLTGIFLAKKTGHLLAWTPESETLVMNAQAKHQAKAN